MRKDYEFLTGVDPKTGKFKVIYITQRSAFDYIAVALTVPPIGTDNLGDTYFPTGKDREAFIEARDGIPPGGRKGKWRGKMQGAPADALRMVEELEPYDGGKHSIRALHDFDISDKYKLLIPAASRLRVNRLDVSFDGTTHSLGMTDFQPDTDGLTFTALFRATLHQLNMKGNFQPSFEIVFGKGQPLEGQPIVVTLFNITDVAERFVETCEAHFL
jgi:hypothetical protein